jgi:hypothetical protein
MVVVKLHNQGELGLGPCGHLNPTQIHLGPYGQWIFF